LIYSANKGYERNPIPSPSPGVGGYCLTKDPYIYNSSFAEIENNINLGEISRKSNEEALKYPIKVLNRFSKKINKPLKKLNVSIIGMAFKGVPETNDLRGSASMELINKIENKVNKIFVWDAIVSKDKLNLNNLLFIEKLNDHIEISDALIFMNNHPENRKINFLNINKKELLVFDGWAQFDSRELEKIKGITYSTMGYITD
jgi:UDP-N-acetyl-D-mannosaminuronic acid dehydrogenase